MSALTFLLVALAGQIGVGDRYGAAPPLNSTPGTTANPGRGSAVSPPPAFSPALEDHDTAPIDETSPAVPDSRVHNQSPSATPPAANVPSNVTPPINDTTHDDVRPSELMAAMLTAPAGSRLSGRPVTLADVIRGASTRAAKSQRINAYWDLCSAVADYYLRVREQDELQQMRASLGNVRPGWQQAEAALGVRLGTAQRAAIASQYRLADLMGATDASSLPLPADLPHSGDYHARFDQVFAGRPNPEAQQLSELLPMRYSELCDAATAVARAEKALRASSTQRGDDGSSALQTLELISLRRRVFLEIARDYNRRIERYCELASPGEIDSDRLIGMLIIRPESANTATRPATTAPSYNRQSRVELREDAQTFAEGWESIKSASAETSFDENVKPASAEAKRVEPRRERSLLVTPAG